MPIDGRDLTEDEFAELHELADDLYSKSVAYDSSFTQNRSPLSEIRHAHMSFDLDLVRSYAKLLPLMRFKVEAINETVVFLHGEGVTETSSWLTVEHVEAYESIHRAILVHDRDYGRFDTRNNKMVCNLLFPDCSNASLILSLIVDRGIAFHHDIVRALRELPRNHSAVQSGSL